MKIPVTTPRRPRQSIQRPEPSPLVPNPTELVRPRPRVERTATVVSLAAFRARKASK